MFKVDLVGASEQICLRDSSYVVQPDSNINDLQQTDLIIIPPMSGNMLSAVEKNDIYVPWIRNQYRKGAQVASLCVGAFLLAETGLLNERYCSTHWKTVNEFKMRYPKVRLVDHKILTDDSGIYTSGGANSYWNLLIYLVGKFTAREIAIRTGKYFEVDLDRNEQGLYSSFEGSRFHSDEPIQKVQNYLERNYQEKPDMEQLSKLSCLSLRTLQRRFKKAHIIL